MMMMIVTVLAPILFGLTKAADFQFGYNAYTLHDEPQDWNMATKTCLAENKTLLDIQNEVERRFVAHALTQRKWSSVWTSGYYSNYYWHWCRETRIVSGQGCFSDDCGRFCITDRHDLNSGWQKYDPVMTNVMCKTYCRAKGYPYCGLQSGDWCYCSEKTGQFGMYGAATGCNKPCPGNKQEKCGAEKKNYIFSTARGAYSKWYNYHPESTVKRCAAMVYEHDFEWLEDSCFAKKAFICEQGLSADKTCKYHTLSYNFCIYISPPGEALTWFEARERCRNLSADAELATVNLDHEHTALKDYLGRNNRKEDFWLGVTRNQLTWRVEGRDAREGRKMFYAPLNESTSFKEKKGCFDFGVTTTGYKMSIYSCNVKKKFICKEVLPTTTSLPTTSTTTIETTTTTDVSTEAGKGHPTEEVTSSANVEPWDPEHQKDTKDTTMIGLYAGVATAVLVILVIIIIIIIYKRKKRKSKKKREKTFKINYAPSIHDLDRRSVSVLSQGKVNIIEEVSGNLYVDPAQTARGSPSGELYDNAEGIEPRREQSTNKARMRAIQEGTYDVPPPRLSRIPAAPPPQGIDGRAPVPLPTSSADVDKENRLQDPAQDSSVIYSTEGEVEQYSYAYGNFREAPEAKKPAGKVPYERLIN